VRDGPTKGLHAELRLGRGVWPAARAKRDWMRPSVVRVSADLGDPAELGNDFLPDAVLKHLRSDALPSYVAGHQLQPSQSDVLTPRGAATASTCRNAALSQAVDDVTRSKSRSDQQETNSRRSAHAGS
jgi:hypothetical protein